MMRLAPLEDEADSVMVIPSSHWSCGYPSGIGIVAILTYFNNQLINLYYLYTCKLGIDKNPGFDIDPVSPCFTNFNS